MVIRIAEFDVAPAFHREPATLTAFRAWIASQPGYRGGWHATEIATGKLVAISLWDDRASVVALKERPFPGGALGAKPARVTIYERVESLSEEP
jgi:hypothetical protein